MEKARARSDSVGYDWYFIGLGRIGATGIGMVATVDWRSAASFWAQCRYIGTVHLFGAYCRSLCSHY